MKILLFGLPGNGKEELAGFITRRMAAKGMPTIHLNAEVIRSTLNRDLGFSLEDRIENARRLGCVADILSDQNTITITNFVCPTRDTRKVFGADVRIWVNIKKVSLYPDTNELFEDPETAEYDLMIKEVKPNHEGLIDEVKALVKGVGTERCKQRRLNYVPSFTEFSIAQKNKSMRQIT